MTVDVVCLFISCVIVIILHMQSIPFMVQVFQRKQTSYPSSLTSNSTISPIVSSVWCHVYGHRKSCTFQNLCYVPHEKQFVFTVANSSIISGVSSINDLKTIDLSSVINHNRFVMKIAIVTPNNAILRRNRINIARGFILWRFKWDNIMHVIHDDLLPLYTTYEDICTGDVDKCVSNYHIAFADEGQLGPLSEWYSIFSMSEPIILQKGGINNIICFEESRTGLISDTVWFQYGFGIPQGPVTNTQLDGNRVRRFSEFVFHKFKIPVPHNLHSTNVVFFSRKINRKILNEGTVVNKIEHIYKDVFPSGSKLQIHKMDLVTNNTRDILHHLSQSRFVVGMHGSAMILTIFLKPGSVIIELFPFAINPQYVSPVKAICDLPDVGLLYKSWVNTKEENTVTHPDAPPLLGGISHLPPTEQEQITNMIEIPAVECCHNPAYLYRMFQDTLVGNDIDVLLKDVFWKQREFSEKAFSEECMSQMLSQWYFPAPVGNILCSYTSQNRIVTVTWDPPPNVKDPEYHIAVFSNSSLQFSAHSKHTKVELFLPTSVHGDTTIDLWVKCVEWGHSSLDTHMQCKIYA